jgi:hypothetical protein
MPIWAYPLIPLDGYPVTPGLFALLVLALNEYVLLSVPVVVISLDDPPDKV